MKKIFFALVAFALFSSHVMYLKLDTYFLEPNTSATLKLFNGTFDKSENVIDRERMLDVSLVGNGKRMQVPASQWSEKDSVTLLNFQTGKTGTWVAGISTKPRSIEMDAEAFNTYLEHEGILDMLDWRGKNGQLEDAAVEKYAKHVKTIFQVGNQRTTDWQTALGYPIEFVPLANPYDLNTGDSLSVKLLLNGQPLANQLVYANFKAASDAHSHEDDKNANVEHGHSHEGDKAGEEHEPNSSDEESSTAGHSHDNTAIDGHSHDEATDQGHSHEKKNNQKGAHHHDKIAKQEHSHDAKTEVEHSHADESEQGHSHQGAAEKEHTHEKKEAGKLHQHPSGQQLRTDASGIVTAKLTSDGIWYLQAIHLEQTKEEAFTHESNWTTLTFEVSHGHGENTHTHDDEAEGGFPSYVYWIGSLLLIGALFFWFNKKNN